MVNLFIDPLISAIESLLLEWFNRYIHHTKERLSLLSMNLS